MFTIVSGERMALCTKTHYTSCAYVEACCTMLNIHLGDQHSDGFFALLLLEPNATQETDS